MQNQTSLLLDGVDVSVLDYVPKLNLTSYDYLILHLSDIRGCQKWFEGKIVNEEETRIHAVGDSNYDTVVDEFMICTLPQECRGKIHFTTNSLGEEDEWGGYLWIRTSYIQRVAEKEPYAIDCYFDEMMKSLRALPEFNEEFAFRITGEKECWLKDRAFHWDFEERERERERERDGDEFVFIFKVEDLFIEEGKLQSRVNEGEKLYFETPTGLSDEMMKFILDQIRGGINSELEFLRS